MKLPLTKPITAYGKEVTELDLRVPTGDDMITCGVPLKWETSASGSQFRHINADSVANYISALGNIPPSSVKTMAPRDIMKAAEFISSFFGDETPKTSSEATSQ